MNLSNFVPVKYKRALLNLQNQKKVLKNKQTKNAHYLKKNNLQFFGPYNRLINGDGGFCKRLYNKNNNLAHVYHLFPQNVPKYKLNTEKNDNDKKKEFSYKNQEKKKRKHKSKNILIQKNEDDKNKVNKNYNIRYNLRNKKKSSLDKEYKRLNLEDVNNSIKYLKLDNKYNSSIQPSKVDIFLKNKTDEKESYKKKWTY